MPNISIIIPVYNSEMFLNRCLDSILLQQYRDYEVLLVDDGSEDRSGEICEEYALKDDRVHVFHQSNQGQAVARNVALDWIYHNSSSNWILFIDSDDYIHPNMLSFLMDSYSAFGRDCDIIAFQVVKGESENYSWPPLESQFEEKNGKVFMRYCILNNDDRGWILPNKIYKRKCFEAVRFPEGRIHEDNATVYKLLFNSEVLFVSDSPLYYYYTNNKSTMNTAYAKNCYDLKRLDWILVLEEMIAFFSDNPDKELKEWAERFYEKSLLKAYNNLLKYYPKSPKKREILGKIRSQYKQSGKCFLRGVRTDPKLENVVHPHLSCCYWTLFSVLNRIKKSLNG